MLFKNISIIDENQKLQKNMYVGTEADKIIYIGSVAPSAEDASKFGEVYDGEDKLLMSAFYNAHAHCAMVLLRSRSDNLPLQSWLTENCFPFEAKMTAEDNYWGMQLGLAEMARYGIVSLTDLYYHSNTRCRAVSDAKMKANIAHHIADFEGIEFSEHKDYEYYKNLVKD